MTEVIIGTCSICGGPVRVPKVTTRGQVTIPTCQDCGRVQSNKREFGPIIVMVLPESR